MNQQLGFPFICAILCFQNVHLDHAAGDIIAQWTFETNPPLDLTDSSTISNIAADTGIGIASGFHSDTLTDWSTPTGNGSTNSLSATRWNVGDFFQFSTSTTGFENIVVSVDQTSSSTGPMDFSLSYRSGVGSFSNFATYSVSNGSSDWSTTTYKPAYSFVFDLSTIPLIDNTSAIDLRLTVTSSNAAGGGTMLTGGTNRVDNFTVSGTALATVPEPSCVLFAAGALAALITRRRMSLA